MEAAPKSKEGEDKEARLLLTATSQKLRVDLTFDSLVSLTATSLTATSSSSTESNENILQQQNVNLCCAGDYCFVSNGHKLVCDMTYCRRYHQSYHYDCCKHDEYSFKICAPKRPLQGEETD